jgi:cytochrome subunit of sulfide dehydrogenase
MMLVASFERVLHAPCPARARLEGRGRAFAAAVTMLVFATPAAAGEMPAGASSCSGCHPASAVVTTPVKRLVGRPAPQIVAALQAFRAGERPATVMDRIAKGFSEPEIAAIAAWYAAQKE